MSTTTTPNTGPASPPVDKPRGIETSIVIDAPIEQVWKAITDAEELTRWFPLEARVKPGKGGAIFTSWKNEYQFETPIAEWEPNKHLKLIYCEPIPPGTKGPDGKEMFPVPFQVACDYYLEARGGKTVLRIVHSGFSSHPAWDNQFDGTVRGWESELRGLRLYLEHHRGKPRNIVTCRRFITCSPEEAWTRLVGREGLLAEGSLDSAKEGAHYTIRTAAGDRITGTVLFWNPPKDFAAVASEWNNAYLRARIDSGCFPLMKPEANLWISTYGLSDDEVTKLTHNYEILMSKLFDR